MESVTTVPYTGAKPTVSVAYLQADGTLLVQGVMSQINITTTDVVIDHGGAFSGVVKLLVE
jgi:hypothetical protein